MRKYFPAAVLALYALLPLASRAADEQPRSEILVFAAASLTDVMQKVGADFSRAHGQAVKFSFGSSATLARQIKAGAAPDIFISADEEWMDYIEQRNLIDRASRKNLFGNRLVLISPASQPVTLRIEKGFKLNAALGASGRLAVGDPASVPAGKYAKAALTALSAWDDVATRLAPADNVRMALLYVSRGEAPLGIVYLTDAKADANVRIVGEFPESSHAPIRYPGALTSKARPGAAEFLAYLQGAAARARFDAAGFQSLGAAPGAGAASKPASANNAESCTHQGWDMSPEARLFQGTASSATAAGPDGNKAPTLHEGRLFSLALVKQSASAKVSGPDSAAASGSKHRHSDGAYGGAARFSVSKSGRYRVTADGPFWIDVLAGATALKATAFHGWHECALYRKAVEYDLTAGVPFALQLSGAARSPVRVSIVASSVTAGTPPK